MLLDTSGLLSALDASQRHHHQCVRAIAEAAPPLLLSPFVMAELHCLLMRHVGGHAPLALLDEVARAREVVGRYADLDVGLADASIAVLAERHFRAMRIERRKRFKILPFDR